MRADLLALTPESLAVIANVGLVKRAQREIAEGRGPRLEEQQDGTVRGTFPDGIIAELPPGAALATARCSCPATTVCRHRLAVALTYAAWHAATYGAREESREVDPWWPAALTEEALVAAIGARTVAKADALLARGGDVELTAAGPETPAVARLPTATVQFLVPGDLAYARCDCVAGHDCEHVALAVRAFRLATPGGAAHAVVHLAATAQRRAAEEDPTEAAWALAAAVLAEGVVHLESGLAARVTRACDTARGAGCAWLADASEDVARMVSAYHARSARYAASRVATLLAEIAARTRAGRGGGALPVATVLGSGEPPETALGHTRLVAVGARLEADDRAREAEAYLVDPEAGVVLVYEKRWTFRDDKTPVDGAALGQRWAWPGVRFAALAAGQLVTQSATRRANRGLHVSGRRGTASVVAQTGDWDALPVAVLVRDLAAHAAGLASRPPAFLRPRVLADSLRVVAVGAVRDVGWAPGAQTLLATVEDVAGNALLLALPHRGVAPHAAAALHRALTGPDPLRFVSGHLRATPAGFELAPVAVVAGTSVIVPDLAEPAPLAAPAVDEPPAASPLHALADAAWERLSEAAHRGLRHVSPPWHAAVADTADRLLEAGLEETAALLRALSDRVRTSTRDGAAAHAWADAALRVALLAECERRV